METKYDQEIWVLFPTLIPSHYCANRSLKRWAKSTSSTARIWWCPSPFLNRHQPISKKENKEEDDQDTPPPIFIHWFDLQLIQKKNNKFRLFPPSLFLFLGSSLRSLSTCYVATKAITWDAITTLIPTSDQTFLFKFYVVLLNLWIFFFLLFLLVIHFFRFMNCYFYDRNRIGSNSRY